MNVIIVDDSIQTVKAIEHSIDWNKLGIIELYTANNISQAKELLSKHEIQIMISDIEMPQGNGLELIKWAKIHSPQTESVLLTCYAEFDYAKKAIELGSFDYLVKPIPFSELEEIIHRLIVKIEEGSIQKRYSEYWVDNQPFVEEKFWGDLLTRKISEDIAIIENWAKKRNVAYSKDAEYLLILLTKKRLIAKLEVLDQNTLMLELKSLAAQIIMHNLSSNSIVILEDKIAVILTAEYNKDRKAENVKKDCIEYILACNKKLGCSMSCYIGKYSTGEFLADMLNKLQQMDNNNVSSASKVFDLNTNYTEDTGTKILIPNLNEWALLFHNGQSEQVIEMVTKYMDQLVKAGKMDGKLLNILQQDILQILHSFLEQKGIQAHQLFNDEESDKLYIKAKKSIDGMIDWITYAFNKAVSYADEVTKAQSVIGKVKEYIKNNYNKDMTREDVANFVFLNPDYLTRIFKKATGLSLSEYLTEQRINKSMSLLVNTNIQVSDIACEVGYNTVNYFSKMFKKVTGTTPVEYRKKNQHI